MGKRQTDSESNGERVNLKTLASLLELSQTTISLVLNDSPAARSIPAQTRERVFEAARKFNYRPNYFARSLRQSRSMSIAVLAPDLSEGYFTVVMNGVQAALIEAHYFYFTASHHWDPELIREYPRRMIEREHALAAPPMTVERHPVLPEKTRRGRFWPFALGFLLGALALFGLALFASFNSF